MNNPYLTTIINTVIGIIIGACVTAIKTFFSNEKKQQNDINLLKTGICAIERQKLLTECEKHLKEGCCPEDTKSVLNELSKSYHDLGGNGLITQLVSNVNNLPNQRRKRNGKD